jgi:putative transposase
VTSLGSSRGDAADLDGVVGREPQALTNGLYKTGCGYGPDTAGWDGADEPELATLSWVHWCNEHRLHSHCNDVPPAEFEAAFYASQHTDHDMVGIR